MALATNLISHWKLDESSGNASDSVGSNTLTNTNVTYGAGKLNNCAIFNGSNARLVSPAVSINSTGFSVSFWVKTSTTTRSMMIASDAGASPRVFQIAVNASGVVELIRFNSSNAVIHITDSVKTINDNRWHHVAVTFNTTNGSKIYIDSILDATNTTLTANNNASLAISFGSNTYSTPGEYFNGSLDEPDLYSRELSADEVSQLFNSGRANAYPYTDTPSLYGFIEYFKTDESSGNSVGSILGTILTNVNGVTYPAGKINNDANFVATSSQQLTIPTTFPELNSDTAWGIMFWMKTSDTTIQMIGTRCNSSAYAQWNIMKLATGRILFEISPANSSTNRLSVRNTTGNVLTDGTWHHVAIAKDTTRLTSGISIWIDGVSTTVVDDSTNTLSSNAPTGSSGAIGSRTPTYATYYTGQIGEIGFITRKPSQSDINTVYNSGNAYQYPFITSISITVTPSVLSATLSLPASSVITSATIAPSVQSVVSSLPSASVKVHVTPLPAVQSAVFSLPTVNIITPDAMVMPSPLAITSLLPQSTVRTDTITPANVLESQFLLPVPSVALGIVTSPSVLSANLSILAPTVSLPDAHVDANVLALTVSHPASTVYLEQYVLPSVLSATFSTPSVVITAIRNVIIDPSALVITSSILSPIIRADFWYEEYPAPSSGFWGETFTALLGTFWSETYQNPSSGFWNETF